ncbi:argininosuccinate lyase [Desulfonatronovibrio hydrogenovorans]|uniref:argininosuccinate lyase n=1 Tax=Desulfonatronovibrio hydrogenovorans TaxID=53245 RepID=UPI00048AA93F|nr:argininosuccinate lyase [Desulfonatronovibrio hydrogenovorans]
MKQREQESSKLWGGRFKEKTSSLVEQFTQSLDHDRRLYAQDIAGSKAHAAMLGRQGVLTAEEAGVIISGLEQIRMEIESGIFVWSPELEDVHMNIEKRLTEIVGPVGQKLHTGRSRNDQVALDFRLFVRESLLLWQKEIKVLVQAILGQAQKNREAILPGYTHLQPAQPVSLAQHLLAYAQMLKRDHERAEDALKRVSVSPLGAAALAGTTYPLDPGTVAGELGLEKVFANSMDAVSDRDFALEGLFVSSLIMTHLSRLSEEIIIWSNPGFGFILLPDAYSTGSSIMPQKKNPDVAELVRGKTGSVFGRLVSLLTTMKALPLTYNRDMQEDKGPYFEAHDTVVSSLRVMSGMVEAMEFDKKAMVKALKKGFLNATEMADYLTSRGMPFRQAHHVTGEAVAFAEKKGVGLEDLALEDLKSFSDLVDKDIYDVLDYGQAVKRRNTPGGTGPESVSVQMAGISSWLNESA